ncbi:MAG TPA: signal peptidase I [Candidatus Nanopelagicales bacterium]|nr:signal peptidase I [Candidatus Nanopelagicales bacterium]
MATTDPGAAADGASIDVPEPPYSRVRLGAGILGRTWLWFLAGCLVITVLPTIIGWRPYLIESGSMGPRINVGDVVIASPATDAAGLVGHVAVFTDPDRPDRNKTHRVVSVAPDGKLVTKGDANATNDSTTVAMESVHGMGRLLVRFAGLPVVWFQTGQWWWLLLLLASVVLSARWVGRDHEDDPPAGGPEPPGADPVGAAGTSPDRSGLDLAAMRPTPLERTAPTRSRVRLAGYGLVLAAALLLPTSTAAFSSTTKTAGNSWAVPNWDYTTEVKALGPYLYWKLDESGGAGTAGDSSGNNRSGTYNVSGSTTYFTQGITGALPTDTPNRAVTLKRATSCINTTSTTGVSAPSTVTVVAWVKGAPGTNGKVVGFEKPQDTVAAPSTGTYDRMLYVDGGGNAWFAAYNGGYFAIKSGSAVTDGGWHMLVGSLGPAGMRLYVDGVQVASNANTGAEATTGWWRAGCGNLAGWGSYWDGGNDPGTDSASPANRPFVGGSIDEVSVFTSQLTAAQVSWLYATR